MYKKSQIIAISVGGQHVAGLRADGTVVVTAPRYTGRSNDLGWKDIVAVSEGYNHTRMFIWMVSYSNATGAVNMKT